MRDQEIAKECKEYVSSHALSEMITREVMAKELNYTPSHLSRRFKQATGMSLMKYVREVEMREIAELLRGGMSVTDAVAIKGCSKKWFYESISSGHGYKSELCNKTRQRRINNGKECDDGHVCKRAIGRWTEIDDA